MSDAELSADEKKLQKLGQHVRQGWSKLHPLKPKEMDAVREAMQRQFKMDQQQALEQPKLTPEKSATKTQTQKQAKEIEQRQQKSQGKDYGHEH